MIRQISLTLALAGLAMGCDQSRPTRTEVPEAMAPAAVAMFPVPSNVRPLRTATAPYRTLSVAEAAGYAAFGGCFQDSVMGGMGFHYANQALIADSAINVATPELLVYAPQPNGERRLAAVEYIVFQDEWHAKGHVDPPVLFGHTFHLNPTLLAKPFYLLHVWVWAQNPSGLFMDWNPTISCANA